MFGSQYKDISSKAKTIYSFQQPNKYKDRVIKFNKKGVKNNRSLLLFYLHIGMLLSVCQAGEQVSDTYNMLRAISYTNIRKLFFQLAFGDLASIPLF